MSFTAKQLLPHEMERGKARLKHLGLRVGGLSSFEPYSAMMLEVECAFLTLPMAAAVADNRLTIEEAKKRHETVIPS